MSGSRIPDLSAVAGADTTNNDSLLIYDASADATKRVLRSELAIGLAGDIPFTPTGFVAATKLASAVAEVVTDLTATSAPSGASLIGVAATGDVSATTVQAALNELDTEKVGFARLDDSDGADLVGFIQSGTGAAVRTVQDKLQEGLIPSPEDYGAVGDGVTDDTAAMQAAWDANKLVRLASGKTYMCSNLTIPNTSGWTLIGRGATIKKISSADNHYLCAASKYLNNVAEAQAPINIIGVAFNGNGIAEHPLIVQNWGSYIEASATGGLKAGCLFTAETRDGTTFASASLVNSKFLLKSFGNGGCGFRSTDANRNNATDGTILPGSIFYDNDDYAIAIEAGAGWDVVCRTYNNGGGVYFNGHGVGTSVHDSYIDDGAAGSVSALPETGLTFSGAIYANAALGATSLGLLPVRDCFIDGIVTHIGSGDAPPYGIDSKDNIYGPNGRLRHGYFASTRRTYTTNDKFIHADPIYWHSGSSTGVVVISRAYLDSVGRVISGSYNAVSYSTQAVDKAMLPYNRRAGLTPSAFSVGPYVSPPFGNYTMVAAKVFIYARANYNSTLRVAYEGTVFVQRKTGVTITATLSNVIYDAADWTTAPAISVVDNGDDTVGVTVTGDFADADAYGGLVFSWQV